MGQIVKLKTGFVFLLGLAISSTALAQDISLRWKFSPQASARYSLLQTAKLDLQLQAGGEVDASVEREFKFRWSVEKVEDDGSAWVSVRVDAVRLKVTGPGGQETVFDSEGTEEPRGYAATLAPLFRTLQKSDLKAHLTARGEILDLEVPEDLELVLSTKPVGKALGTLGTKDDLRTLVRLAMPKLAEESLSPGDHWTAEQSRDAVPFGAAMSQTEYKLESMETVEGEQLAKIAPRSKIQLIESDAGEPEAKIVDQKSTGRLMFNVSVGRPASYELQETLQLETTGADQPASGTIEHSLRLTPLEQRDKN